MPWDDRGLITLPCVFQQEAWGKDRNKDALLVYIPVCSSGSELERTALSGGLGSEALQMAQTEPPQLRNPRYHLVLVLNIKRKF